MLSKISNNWALVEIEAQGRTEERTPGGLVIPNAFENVCFAKIVKIGNPNPYPGTDIVPEPLTFDGDRVLIQNLRAIPTHTVTFEGNQYRLIRHTDIIGVVAPVGAEDTPKDTAGGITVPAEGEPL